MENKTDDLAEIRAEKRAQILELCADEDVALADIEDIVGDDDIFAII